MLMHNYSVIVRYYRIFCEHQLQEAGFDLGLPEQSVLLLIEAFGQSNQDTIARHLMIDKGSITKTIAKLESKGLIQRWENPDNKRENLLILTPACQPALKVIHQANHDWDQLLSATVPPDLLACTDKTTTTQSKNAILAIEKIHQHHIIKKQHDKE